MNENKRSLRQIEFINVIRIFVSDFMMKEKFLFDNLCIKQDF